MREIKFRYWYEPSKMMEYSDGSFVGQKGVECMEPFFHGYDYNNEEDKKPLMQFTGLKDKNGKEIYEGDIVKCTLGNFEKNGSIIFAHSCFMLELRDNISKYNQTKFPLITNDYTLEVIGNIYENPEMI